MEQPQVELTNVSKRYGPQLVVDQVSFTIRKGEFFSLLGSSGCGKSTTLRMIAGFETPDEGSVRIGRHDGKTPAYVSHINMVFQNYALFPHLTVAENVGFGLKMAKTAASVRENRVREMLELVQLADYGNRLPRQLSGGQQQRVALARALATKPEVVLLDEPLGALDLKLRKEMQHELKHIQEELGLTFVYVTHDQEEALAMSDRICVMHQGRAMQIGTPEQIYQRPTSRFVADFIGQSNFLPGEVSQTNEDHTVVDIGGFAVKARLHETLSHKPGDQVLLAIRPERINFGTDGENATTAQIDRTVFCGGDRIFHVTLPTGQLMQVREQTDAAPAAATRGSAVQIGWPVEAVCIVE